MSKRKPDVVYSVTVSATGTWSYDGLSGEGNRFSVTTYSRYHSVAEMMAEAEAGRIKDGRKDTRVLHPGAVLARFDAAPYGNAVDAAYKGAMMDPTVPAGCVRRFVGMKDTNEPYDPENPPRALDYVALDVWAHELMRFGVPVQPAAFAYVDSEYRGEVE